jgi:nicotinamidase-related amidase
MDRAVRAINPAIEFFRSRGLPVIWVQNENDQCPRNSPGFEMIDSLKPEDAETRILKHYTNSFNKTGLADHLRQLGADTVVVSGYAAEYCVISTYTGTRDHDMTPVLLKNGTASGSGETVKSVEAICDVISLNILKRFLA